MISQSDIFLNYPISYTNNKTVLTVVLKIIISIRVFNALK